MGWLLAPMIRGDSHSKLRNIIVGCIGGLLGYQYVLGLTSANLYLTIATAIEMILFIAFLLTKRETHDLASYQYFEFNRFIRYL